VARGAEGRAFRFRDRDALYGCLYAKNRGIILADDAWYPRPAVAFSGPRVAFAAEVGEPAENSFTEIAVDDLRRSLLKRRQLTITLPSAKIGSLRLRGKTSVAWIECPLEDGFADGNPRPNCVRPGLSRNAVLKRDSDTSPDRKADLLDEGEGIDPRSLRLGGSTLTWIKDGERRSATLK
jgi:hypothetical protein